LAIAFTKHYVFANGNNTNQEYGIYNGVKNKELMMHLKKELQLIKE
jgi:hypothetical protein